MFPNLCTHACIKTCNLCVYVVPVPIPFHSPLTTIAITISRACRATIVIVVKRGPGSATTKGIGPPRTPPSHHCLPHHHHYHHRCHTPHFHLVTKCRRLMEGVSYMGEEEKEDCCVFLPSFHFLPSLFSVHIFFPSIPPSLPSCRAVRSFTLLIFLNSLTSFLPSFTSSPSSSFLNFLPPLLFSLTSFLPSRNIQVQGCQEGG